MIIRRRFFSLTKKEERKFKKWRKEVEEQERLAEEKENNYKVADDGKNLGKITVGGGTALYGLGKLGDHLSTRALNKYPNISEEKLIKLGRAVPIDHTKALKRAGVGAIALGTTLYGAGKLRKRYLDNKEEENRDDSKA